MNRRFKAAFWGIAAAQLALLVALIGLKEYTLNAGTIVVLQTVPVDPRSLLQGDYVALRYKISSLPPHRQNLPVGATVYVALVERGGVWEAEAAGYDSVRPKSGTLFIKGAVAPNGLVDFGIGTYFVPEGAGHLIERARDVKVKVSVLDGGSAVIKEVLINGKPFNPKESKVPDRPPAGDAPPR